GILLGWEQVVVHPNDHRNEYQRVVNQVQLDAGDEKLSETHWHRAVCQVHTHDRLPLQEAVLDVMPELDPEGDHPPGTGKSGKAFTKDKNADQHDQRIAVVQHLGFYEPGKPEPEHATRLGDRPAQHVDLKSLREVFGPVRQHDCHKYL